MSFDFKGPSFKPVIQEAQQMLNNGGGGNLGYFKRGKKDGNSETKAKGDLFEGQEDDSFEHQIELEEDKDFFATIKAWFSDLLKKMNISVPKKKNPFLNQ